MKTDLDRRQLRLVTGSLNADDGRASHRGTYAKRANFDEARARLLLYPASKTVDNVVPIRPEPPAA